MRTLSSAKVSLNSSRPLRRFPCAGTYIDESPALTAVLQAQPARIVHGPSRLACFHSDITLVSAHPSNPMATIQNEGVHMDAPAGTEEVEFKSFSGYLALVFAFAALVAIPVRIASRPEDEYGH